MKNFRIVCLLAIGIIGLAPAPSWSEEVPPGCLPRFSHQGIPPVPGGCSGKALIDSVYLNGPTCLVIGPNNCNGGILVVQNSCKADLKIGNLPLTTDYSTIELFRDEHGAVMAKLSYGNYETYTPSKNETLKIDGMIGNQPFSLSYRKTKPLCQ